ncbi:28S ribosomal protein S27, mitochondrial-like [Neolamprologus brichardi]|uniref:28S ribosomal protein S27, mitochondrial-like n=1 Tax=Neolamprologus brichardi TaxID=32507 RepID=UPI001643E8EB|nr:28S ribosomal protein S27, mitochondrial-like [Neolamprologus brichardi]
MVSSNMAASVLKRCATAAVKVKSLSPSLSARRWLLSAAYTDSKMWEAREKDPQNLDLRDWTIHGWIRQCLKYGARDKALHTLKNKIQYGIFPDDFTFNLLMDSFIKDADFKIHNKHLSEPYQTALLFVLIWAPDISPLTLGYVNDLFHDLPLTSESDSSGEESGGEEDKKENTVDEDDQAEAAKLPEYVKKFKELSSQLESQDKVESTSFQDLVTALAQQTLAAAETPDLEQYESRVQAWEAEKRQLIQREKEMREKAEQEKQERLAAMAAAQQV